MLGPRWGRDNRRLLLRPGRTPVQPTSLTFRAFSDAAHAYTASPDSEANAGHRNATIQVLNHFFSKDELRLDLRA